jgi:hypothetical protein
MAANEVSDGGLCAELIIYEVEEKRLALCINKISVVVYLLIKLFLSQILKILLVSLLKSNYLIANKNSVTYKAIDNLFVGMLVTIVIYPSILLYTVLLTGLINGLDSKRSSGLGVGSAAAVCTITYIGSRLFVSSYSKVGVLVAVVYEVVLKSRNGFEVFLIASIALEPLLAINAALRSLILVSKLNGELVTGDSVDINYTAARNAVIVDVLTYIVCKNGSGARIDRILNELLDLGEVSGRIPLGSCRIVYDSRLKLVMLTVNAYKAVVVCRTDNVILKTGLLVSVGVLTFIAAVENLIGDLSVVIGGVKSGKLNLNIYIANVAVTGCRTCRVNGRSNYGFPNGNGVLSVNAFVSRRLNLGNFYVVTSGGSQR